MEVMKTDIPDDKYRIMSNRELLKLGKNLDRLIASDPNSPILDEENSCLSSKKHSLQNGNQVDCKLTNEDQLAEQDEANSQEFNQISRLPEISMYSVIYPNTGVRTNVLKQVHYKDKQTTLRNIKTDLNMNAISSTHKQQEKDQILKDRKISTLEMIYYKNKIGVYLKDIHGEQIFSTQHIETSSQNFTSNPHQTVKCLSFLPICDKTKLTLPQILTNISAKIYLCPVRDCTQAFLQPSVAKDHTLKHLVIKPYSCSYPGCKWEFYREAHLNRHLNTHEGKRQWVCDIEGCKKDFTTIYNLNEHKRKRHIDPATIPCPVEECQEYFRNVKEQKNHCKSHAESEAPFHCNFENCTRSFFTDTELDIHSRNHTITNRHACNFPNCGKICISSYRLKEHIRSHTGIRPYGCNFPGCKWRFMTSSKLQRHFKTHKDEKSYVCNVPGCNRSYRRNEHLRSHLQTHIQMAEMSETTKCQICGVLHISKSAHMKKFHPDLREIVEPEKILGVAPDSTSPLNLTFMSDETYMSNHEIPKVGCQKGEKSEDEILKEAIKSLGVPELILNEEALMEEPLDLLPAEDFSTVNLKDLD